MINCTYPQTMKSQMFNVMLQKNHNDYVLPANQTNRISRSFIVTVDYVTFA